MLARNYFEEAVRLDPREARYLGFYAGLLMAEGTIHKDEKMVRQDFYAMRDAVRAWPAFNNFTAGYTASGLPTGACWRRASATRRRTWKPSATPNPGRTRPRRMIRSTFACVGCHQR